MGGKHFGELHRVRGLITYKISPFEQRAFAGFISTGIGNSFRRFRGQALRVLPPFILGYLIYDSVEKKHHHLLRKDPAEFANDK
ncbi:cytochrome b-c1 complex subunit 8 [Neocloeon triangulifer]|uniref:cytochrome b-c1 complex subunit 8 n=1 Tax=Neocloeon triangulifer TaxID=2078957 RepID=UPI00286F2C72|nr:cytochrome b-c1 complex subunit 8 [Neocloeon triangulifer]XP_059486965.1 cytochrome b-c1 complex subunit 8 [Neocloeon triangulifer]